MPAQNHSNTTRCSRLTKLAIRKPMHTCFNFMLTRSSQPRSASSVARGSQRNAPLMKCPSCRRLNLPARGPDRESQNDLASDHYRLYAVQKLSNRVERVPLRWNRQIYRHRKTKGQNSEIYLFRLLQKKFHFIYLCYNFSIFEGQLVLKTS